MNRVEHHNEPYHDDVEHRIFSHMGAARYTACPVLILTATWATVIPADPSLYGYVGPARLVSPTNGPIHQPIAATRRKARHHNGVWDLELEQTVNRLCSLR